MSIIFHEGLPGSGKSYEACVFHIIPALISKRQVVTNISGINHEKFSDLTGIPLSTIKSLLLVVEPADGVDDKDVERCKSELLQICPDNALVVWDEVQDYWPSGRDKLPIQQQKFITEHRHRGLDFILMGQDRDDLHQLWRLRIESIVYFCKLVAVGMPDRYRWEYWQRQNKKKFVKTSSDSRNYDSKYFGLYASHTGDHVHKKVYKLKGQNILGGSAMKFGVPAAFIAAIYAVYHLFGFFSGDASFVNQPSASTISVSSSAPSRPVFDEERGPPSTPSSINSAPVEPLPPASVLPGEPLDYVEQIASQNRLRLSAIMHRPDGDFYALIDALDSTHHIKERFTAIDLRALGWDVTRHDYGVKLAKGGITYVVRSWPLDAPGRVNEDSRSTLR